MKRTSPLLKILIAAAQSVAILLIISGCQTAPATSSAPSPPFAAASAPTRQAAVESTSAQPFDYYLLNLSWSPEFCASHPNTSNYPECTQHMRFILHGLWPQNNTGPFIEHCTTAPGPADPNKYADLYPDAGLLQHEWTTHGTCSGLNPDAYFSLARTTFHSVAIPSTLTQLDRQISMPPAEIIGLFQTANPTFPADSFALSCGNNYLTAIEVCVNKSGQPTSCGPIKSCRAQTVRIPSP
jgi:ribonuclease T2